MKVINATASFKIEAKFSKDNFENDIMDYADEIEDLLDYDCSVLTPEVIDEGKDSVTASIPVEAYMEIIDEKDQVEGEEEIKKEVDSGAFQLQTILEDGLNGDISLSDIDYSSKSFRDMYAYKDWVMQDSIMSLLKNDSDFEESFPYLILDSYDSEITGIHKTENALYVHGIDEDGESDEDWSIINDSEDDFFNTYFRVISLKDVDEGDDGFYAADSILCCIDNEYESKIDEDYYDDFDDEDDE